MKVPTVSVVLPGRRFIGPSLLTLGLLLTIAWFRLSAADLSPIWVGTWATAPRFEESAEEKIQLQSATLRQFVRTSLGGHRLRVRLSNLFGTTPLVLNGVHISLAASAGAIRTETDHALRFNGDTGASIPAGTSLLSDPLDFELPPLADVALSIQFKNVPAMLTMHHGSRTNSYLQPGDTLAAGVMADAVKIEHWYFISGIDVLSTGPVAAVVALGDSITDGRGTTTDLNNRWTDALASRLQAQTSTANIGVLNQGIGGNRLLRDGLGTRMLDRFDRDVLLQTGARWVIVQAGINDIGSRLDARKKGEPYASASDIITAFEQLIVRSHAKGIRIIGTTIAPYAGADFYWSADGEADRQTVNHWIRTSGRFDAVVDFDAALRDPLAPSHLAAAFDCGDHLHPSLAGYAEMARVVDLNLFALLTAAAQIGNP